MTKTFSLGARIRELRAQWRLSQEQLALMAGITPAYLGMVERGDKNPTVVTVEKICTALGLSLGEFFAPHQKPEMRIDEIGMQIIYLLDEMSREEKQVVLQLVKQAVRLQALGRRNC